MFLLLCMELSKSDSSFIPNVVITHLYFLKGGVDDLDNRVLLSTEVSLKSSSFLFLLLPFFLPFIIWLNIMLIEDRDGYINLWFCFNKLLFVLILGRIHSFKMLLIWAISDRIFLLVFKTKWRLRFPLHFLPKRRFGLRCHRLDHFVLKWESVYIREFLLSKDITFRFLQNDIMSPLSHNPSHWLSLRSDKLSRTVHFMRTGWRGSETLYNALLSLNPCPSSLRPQSSNQDISICLNMLYIKWFILMISFKSLSLFEKSWCFRYEFFTSPRTHSSSIVLHICESANNKIIVVMSVELRACFEHWLYFTRVMDGVFQFGLPLTSVSFCEPIPSVYLLNQRFRQFPKHTWETPMRRGFWKTLFLHF